MNYKVIGFYLCIFISIESRSFAGKTNSSRSNLLLGGSFYLAWVELFAGVESPLKKQNIIGFEINVIAHIVGGYSMLRIYHAKKWNNSFYTKHGIGPCILSVGHVLGGCLSFHLGYQPRKNLSFEIGAWPAYWDKPWEDESRFENHWEVVPVLPRAVLRF